MSNVLITHAIACDFPPVVEKSEWNELYNQVHAWYYKVLPEMTFVFYRKLKDVGIFNRETWYKVHQSEVESLPYQIQALCDATQQLNDCYSTVACVLKMRGLHQLIVISHDKYRAEYIIKCAPIDTNYLESLKIVLTTYKGISKFGVETVDFQDIPIRQITM